MALAFTEKIELGYRAPEFSIIEPLTGLMRTYDELKSDIATVVMFICNHCPYVKHVNEGLIALANDYQAKGVNFIAVNSNDAIKYPDDSPEKMVAVSKELNYPFVYLFDKDQSVAKDYFAKCTPDFSIFDGNQHCVYRGQMDTSRPGNGIEVSAIDLRKALDDIMAGEKPSSKQIPSAGCSIKWIF